MTAHPSGGCKRQSPHRERHQEPGRDSAQPPRQHYQSEMTVWPAGTAAAPRAARSTTFFCESVFPSLHTWDSGREPALTAWSETSSCILKGPGLLPTHCEKTHRLQSQTPVGSNPGSIMCQVPNDLGKSLASLSLSVLVQWMGVMIPISQY